MADYYNFFRIGKMYADTFGPHVHTDGYPFNIHKRVPTLNKFWDLHYMKLMLKLKQYSNTPCP